MSGWVDRRLVHTLPMSLKVLLLEITWFNIFLTIVLNNINYISVAIKRNRLISGLFNNLSVKCSKMFWYQIVCHTKQNFTFMNIIENLWILKKAYTVILVEVMWQFARAKSFGQLYRLNLTKLQINISMFLFLLLIRSRILKKKLELKNFYIK